MGKRTGFQVTNYLDGDRQQVDMATIIGGGLQPETQVWYSRIIKNGGTVSNTDIAIADVLMTQINKASYRAKVTYLLPFIGNVIKASLVPLIDDSCFGIPRNYQGTGAVFVDADCGTALGLKGKNGANLFIGIRPREIAGTNLLGVGYWERNLNTGGGTTEVCGSYDPTTTSNRVGVLDLRTSGVNTFFSCGNVTNRTTGGPVAGNHHYYGEKSSDSLRTLYVDGASSGTPNTTTDTEPQATPFNGYFALMGCQEWPASTGLQYNLGTCGAFYLTPGTLGATDAASFHTLLNTYLITATGR